MTDKTMKLAHNSAGGVDLLVERDAGNLVRILTGKPEYSLKVWKDLRQLANRAIKILEGKCGEPLI